MFRLDIAARYESTTCDRHQCGQPKSMYGNPERNFCNSTRDEEVKMSKVLIINGSPRVNGNTTIAVREMENVFKENDVEVTTVQVGNKDIRGWGKRTNQPTVRVKI